MTGVEEDPGLPAVKEEEEECAVRDGGEEEEGGGCKKRKKAWRVMLAPAQAVEIYKRRPPLDEVNGKYTHGSMRNASSVAAEYNVSPKTIRDIWNRYSWAKVTRSLWTEQETFHYNSNYVLRGHQGAGSSMRVALSCATAASGQMVAPALHHHEFATPSPFTMAGMMMPAAHPIQLPQPVLAPRAAVAMHPGQPQQQGMGAVVHQGMAEPRPLGWAYGSGAPNAFTEMLQARGSHTDCSNVHSSYKSASSAVDDIGMGSEQMTNFNLEVDQMVGLPVEIFPNAAAFSRSGGDFAGAKFAKVHAAEEGAGVSWGVKPAADGAAAPCSFDFPGGDSAWDTPAFAPFFPDSCDNSSSGFNTEESNSSSGDSSGDLYEQMYRSEKRLNNLLNMNGLPSYSGESSFGVSSAACPPPRVLGRG